MVIIQTIRNILARYRNLNWAITDQAMISAVNFLAGIPLARLLGIEIFGKYILFNMIFLFANSLHMGLVSSPMMVLAGKMESNFRDEYSRSVIGLNILSSILITIGLLLGYEIIKSVFGVKIDSMLVRILIITGLLYLNQDFIRRYLFAYGYSYTAFTIDAIAYVGFMAGVWLIFLFKSQIMLYEVFIISGLTYLIAIVSLFFIFNIPKPIFRRRVIKEHWQQGKWLVGTGLLTWMSYNIIILVAGWLLGTVAVGGLRIAQNLVNLFNPLFLSLENVLPISATKKYFDEGKSGLFRYIARSVFFVIAPIIIILIPVILFHKRIIMRLYGTEYISYSYLLIWFGAASIFVGIIQVLGAGLRASGNARGSFIGMASATLVILGLGYPMIIYNGLQGAAMVFLLAGVTQVFSMTIYFIVSLNTKK